jgi:hypothetical protein
MSPLKKLMLNRKCFLPSQNPKLSKCVNKGSLFDYTRILIKNNIPFPPVILGGISPRTKTFADPELKIIMSTNTKEVKKIRS